MPGAGVRALVMARTSAARASSSEVAAGRARECASCGTKHPLFSSSAMKPANSPSIVATWTSSEAWRQRTVGGGARTAEKEMRNQSKNETRGSFVASGETELNTYPTYRAPKPV